jgi:hypothetical protein
MGEHKPIYEEDTHLVGIYWPPKQRWDLIVSPSSIKHMVKFEPKV